MASIDPALDLVSAPAQDPPKPSKIRNSTSRPSEDLIVDEDTPVAPDQFDPALMTDKLEIWSYYSYYIGNNGLSLFNFAPTAFQNLLYQAEGDSEVLRFAGRDRTINSIVLLSNGISFAIQIVIFLILGSFAGSYSRIYLSNFYNSKNHD